MSDEKQEWFTLTGKLTLLNLSFFVFITLVDGTDAFGQSVLLFNWLAILGVFVFGFPLIIVSEIFRGGTVICSRPEMSSEFGIVRAVILLAVNAFIWGLFAARVIRQTKKYNERRKELWNE